MKKWYALLWVWLCACKLQGQQLRFATYDVNEDLPQSMVTAILRDKAGYLWVGTAGGLARFDGYSFSIYKHNHQNPHSISNNFIRSIREIPGGLLLQTDGGIERFSFANGRFSNIFPHSRMEKELLSPRVVFANDSVALCICDLKGLLLIDLRKNKPMFYSKAWLHMAEINSHPSFTAAAVGHHLFFILMDGLYCFNIKTKKANLILSMPYTGVRTELKTVNGSVWWFDGKWLNEYNPAKQRLLVHTELKPHLPHVAPDNFYMGHTPGKWWIGSSSRGLMSWDKNGMPESYRHDPSVGSSLPSNIVRSLLPDHEGNLWVGTDGRGLAKANLVQNRFSFFPLQTVVGAYTGIMVKSILELPDEKVLAGSYDKGIFCINRKTNQVRHCPVPAAMGQNCIYSMTRVTDGRVLCGLDSGLAWYNPQNNTLKLAKRLWRIRHMRTTTNGFVLTSTNKLLYTDIRLNITGEQKLPLDVNAALFSCSYTQGVQLVASEYQGISVVSRAGVQLLQMKNGMPSNAVRHLLIDPQQRIWAATELGLVCILVKKIHPLTVSIKTYTEADGLANDFVYAIQQTPNGHLWCSTNHGLSELNPATGRFTNYDVHDGLQSNEFNTGAYYQNEKGEVFFGGVNGLNVFDYRQPPANITSTTLRFQSVSTPRLTVKHFENGNTVTLPSGENAFTVHFSAMRLAVPQQVQYAYSLNGMTAIEAGSSHVLSFSGLDPGSHTLSVWASAGQAGSVQAASLHIFIKPYWWQRRWVQLAAGLLVLLLMGFALYQLSTRKLRKRLAEAERVRQLERLRNRISTDIHDDLGSSLSKMALVSELAKTQIQNTSETVHKLDTINRESLEMMNNLREIVWAISPEQDSLAGMLAHFREYINTYMETTGITANIDFEEPIAEVTVGPDTRRNLFLILKEALGNTLKYANATQVNISFAWNGGAFRFQVTDNGQGINPEAMRTGGNGMLNMEKRAADIGAAYSVESKQGGGTTIGIWKQ